MGDTIFDAFKESIKTQTKFLDDISIIKKKFKKTIDINNKIDVELYSKRDSLVELINKIDAIKMAMNDTN